MTLKSVIFSLDSLPSSESFEKVYNFIIENEICSIKKICDSTKLSNDIVNQIVIWLLKYSFISIGRK